MGGRNLMFHIFLLMTIRLSLQEEQFAILRSPNNVTVYQDQWADFICTVSGGFQSWEIEGKPVSELPRHLRDDIDTDRPVPDGINETGWNVLGIIARPEYNGTTFRCVINGGLSDRSDIAILTIQDTVLTPFITVFQDHWAKFTCRVFLNDFHRWTMNGESLYQFPSEDIDTSVQRGEDGVGLEILRVRAGSVYNETVVQCAVVVSADSSIRTEIVTMTIQGTLSEVGDLQTIYNTSSVVIEWIAPFSLDVTGVDHDIWYSVIIYNVTDEYNSTVINCTDCINITDTYYTFTPRPCTIYNISILPINGAGLGNISDNITVEGINLRRANIAAIANDLCKVEFAVECGAQLVESIFLRLDNNIILPISVKGGMIEFHLPEKRMYNSSFLVHLLHGEIEFKSNETFTTFDIQNPYAVSRTDNEILVTGEFIENSTAIGCFLAIECRYTFKITFIVLRQQESQNNISEVIKIRASNYTVYVHDFEEDSLPYIYPSNPNIIPVQVNGSDSENETSGSGDITQNHETVTVNCTPDSEDTSCIVVYRAHGNSTLNLRYNELFPLIITLNHSRTTYYTIALFLITETGYIERTPCVRKMVSVGPVLPRPTITSSVIVLSSMTVDIVTTSINQESVAEIAVATILVVMMIICTIVVLHIILLKEREKLKRHGFKYPSNLYFLYDSCQHCVLKEQGFGRRKQRQRKRNDYSIVEDGVGSQSHTHSSPLSTNEEITYAEVKTRPGQKPRRSESDRVKYEDIDITATNELARSRNAESEPSSDEPYIMSILSPIAPFPVNLPDSSVCVSGNMYLTAPNNDEPIRVELVMSKLYDKSGQWKMIAEVMGFDEDMIDEIDTNDETDEACLQNCVEQWISKLDGSWEKLSDILVKLDEINLNELATNGVCIDMAGEEKSIAHSESYNKEDEVDNMLTTADEDTAELAELALTASHTASSTQESAKHDIEDIHPQDVIPPVDDENHTFTAVTETTQSGVKEEEEEGEEEEHKKSVRNDDEEESSHKEQGETMAEDEKSESIKSVTVTGAQEKENAESGNSDANRSKVEKSDVNSEPTNIFFPSDEDGSVTEEEEGLHYHYEIHSETAIPSQQSDSNSDAGVLVTGYSIVSNNTRYQKPVRIFPIIKLKTKNHFSEEKETEGVVDEITHRKAKICQ